MRRFVRSFPRLSALVAALACGGERGPTEPAHVTIFGCATGSNYTIGQDAWSEVGAGCLDPDGVLYADYYRFTQAAEGPVSIRVSADWDALILGLSDDLGNFIEYDFQAIDFADSGTDHAVVGGVLPAGDYVITVTLFTGTPPASYRLTSDRTLPAEAGFWGCTERQSHTLGGSSEGALAASDCRTTVNTYMDRHEFAVATERSIAISLEASFDAFLYLFDGAGNVIAYNDNGSSGTDSQLTTRLSPGTYSIGASSRTRMATGTYTLTTN